MIEEFATALQKILGPGSKIILIEILKKFHEKEQKLKSGESRLGLCEPHASSAPQEAIHTIQRQRSAERWANIQHQQLCIARKIKEILKQNFN